MKEEWKFIKDFPNYAISNKGNIYSFKRHKMLSKKFHNGTYRVWLTNDKLKEKTVSILVADAFVKNPDNLNSIKYKDGNKENLNYWNLEWVKNSVELHVKNKKKIIHIETGTIYKSIADAGRDLDISPAYITTQLKGRVESAKGQHFKYYA